MSLGIIEVLIVQKGIIYTMNTFYWVPPALNLVPDLIRDRSTIHNNILSVNLFGLKTVCMYWEVPMFSYRDTLPGNLTQAGALDGEPRYHRSILRKANECL